MDGTPFNRSVTKRITEAILRSAILGQVYAGKEPDRHADQGGKQKNLSASDDGIRHTAARLAHRPRQLRKEIPTEVLAAVEQKISQDEEEHANRDQCTHAGGRQHHRIGRLPSKGELRAHLVPFAVVMRISSRAAPLMTMVNANRTRPSSIKALRYRSPVASVNSFAITAAIE